MVKAGYRPYRLTSRAWYIISMTLYIAFLLFCLWAYNDGAGRHL